MHPRRLPSRVRVTKAAPGAKSVSEEGGSFRIPSPPRVADTALLAIARSSARSASSSGKGEPSPSPGDDIARPRSAGIPLHCGDLQTLSDQQPDELLVVHDEQPLPVRRDTRNPGTDVDFPAHILSFRAGRGGYLPGFSPHPH